jgi:hypothetical protein
VFLLPEWTEVVRKENGETEILTRAISVKEALNIKNPNMVSTPDDIIKNKILDASREPIDNVRINRNAGTEQAYIIIEFNSKASWQHFDYVDAEFMGLTKEGVLKVKVKGDDDFYYYWKLIEDLDEFYHLLQNLSLKSIPTSDAWTDWHNSPQPDPEDPKFVRESLHKNIKKYDE